MSTLLDTCRHTAEAMRNLAASAAAPDADHLAVARQLAALAGGLEAEIARAVAAADASARLPPSRPTRATPALIGAERLHREGVTRR